MTRHIGTIHQSDPYCLANLKARREGVRDENGPAKIGTAVHRAAEEIVRLSDTPGFDALAVGRRVIAEMAYSLSMTTREASEALRILEDAVAGEDALRFFVEPGCDLWTEFQWALDERFNPCAAGPDAAFSGTMDQVQVRADPPLVRVVDYKTVRAFTSSWELSQDWQARVYALAALAYFPDMTTVVFRLSNLRHRYWVDAEFRRGDPWELNTRTLLSAALERRRAAIKADEWPATLGDDCGYCPILFRCEAVRAAAEQGADVIGDLDPGEIARRKLAIGALATRYEKAARSLCDRDGPIDLGDGTVLGGKPTQGWTLVRDYDATLAQLREWGMTPAQEVEWFRHCASHHMASRVKSAMHDLLGKGAKQAIEDGVLVEPVAVEQFGVWRPDPPLAERDLSAFDEWLGADAADSTAPVVTPKEWDGEFPF